VLIQYNANNNAASYQYGKRKEGTKTHIKVLNVSLSRFGLPQSRCIIAPVQAVKGCKHKGIQLHKKMNI